MFFMIMGSIAAYFLFGHVRIRVATWLDPWSDIDVTGYQITQALFATASGDFLEQELALEDQIIYQWRNQISFSLLFAKKWVFSWA